MSFSTRCMNDDDWTTLQHFTKAEFEKPQWMGLEFLQWLEQVRITANVPMTITSSYRSPGHNVAVGGASDSAHTDVPCNAVDIGKRPTPDDPHWNIARGKILRAAIAHGLVRWGSYNDGSIHLDRTEDRRPAAAWIVVDNPAH